MALEELPALAVEAVPGELTVHLHGPLSMAADLGPAGHVDLRVDTRYPSDGDVTIHVEPARPARFTLRLRCPSWADGAFAEVGGERVDCRPGEYLGLGRVWQPGDQVRLHLPLRVALHERRNRNVQESRAPDGSAVRQAVLDLGYVALTRGPLVYATPLIDGFKTDETVRLPALPLDRWVTEAAEGPVPVLRMALEGRPALEFRPYFLCGGREDGSWRLTWLSLAPRTSKIP
jgi:DUF1680 family protein